MALIKYTINKDAAGRASVSCSIESINPGDKVIFVSDQAGTAIQCGGDSPFHSPSGVDLYKVSTSGVDSELIPVVNQMEKSSVCEWVCGEIIDNQFTPWPGVGPIFPPIRTPVVS